MEGRLVVDSGAIARVCSRTQLHDEGGFLDPDGVLNRPMQLLVTRAQDT